MRVLLINPPVKCSPGLNLGTQNRAQSFHIGLLYIAAVLEENGHAVEVVDCGAAPFTWEDLGRLIWDAHPDLIGITATTPSFRNAVQTSKLAKEIFPAIPVILGGYHPTFFSREILERVRSVDWVARGEAEFTMMELANGMPLEEIPGLSYRTANGEIRENSDREPVKDLDILPFPARHLVRHYQYGSMGGIFQMAHPRRYTSLFTSRGCPYQCRYCCVHTYSKGTYRTRSVENIEKEIAQLVKDGIDSIYIQDDNFAVNKHLPMICEMLKGFPVKWFCLARVDANPDHYKRMAEAGCRGIYFGVESCSQRILDYYQKKTTPEQVRHSIAKAKEAGLEVIVTLIVGAPMETWDDVMVNQAILTHLDIDVLELNILTYFPYTGLWEEVPSEKRTWDRELLVSEIFSGKTLEEMLAWCHFLKRSFYRRKRYIARQVWRTITRRRDLLLLNLANIPRILGYLKN